MTRITDRKIPFVYIHVHQIGKNRGPGLYNSLRHDDNRKYLSGLSLQREIEGKRIFLTIFEFINHGKVIFLSVRTSPHFSHFPRQVY